MLIKIFDEFFDLRKVTINANQGGAGGYTLFTPKERFNNYPTKKFMLANFATELMCKTILRESFCYNMKSHKAYKP